MRGLRRSTQRARNKGKIAQGAAIQMNHFLLNVEMSEWRSSTEQGIKEYGPCNVALPHARRRDRAPLGQKIEAVEGVVPAGVASSVAPPLVIPFGMKPNLNNLTSNDSNQQQARGTFVPT